MSINKIQDVFNKERDGKTININTNGATQGTATSFGGVTAGGILMTIAGGANAIGSTPATPTAANLQDMLYQAGLTSNPLRLYEASLSGTRISTKPIMRIYKIGTVDLTGTGQKLTHDAATFPVLRTQMGTSQLVRLIPFLCVTVATSVTAPVFTIKYVNGAGAMVTGTRQLTFPNVATLVGSCGILMLEDILAAGGAMDTTVQDITEVNIATASTTGSMEIWGMEILAMGGLNNVFTPNNINALTSPIALPDINPAVATSGSVVSKLLTATIGSAATNSDHATLRAFIDD